MISTNLPHQHQPGATTSKYFLNPQTKAPSPPEATLYANLNNMPQTPPSSNTSPSDSHSHLNVRQVRQPRQPLYVPAALRPTDHPTRPTNIPNRPRAPDTPPASKDNSFDSGSTTPLAQAQARGQDTLPDPSTLPNSPDNSLDLDSLRRGLSRAGSDCLSTPSFPEVHGPPTTAHWKPDSSANTCSICLQPFTFFFRRHHCRSCGDVVCDVDSRKKIPLDENARYNVNGLQWRACDKCAGEWEVVMRLRMEGSLAAEEGQGPGGLTIPQRPSLADPGMAMSLARSQGAMEWSTF